MTQPFFSFFHEALRAWREDDASRMAAALAYYAVFALAPILFIIIVIGNILLSTQSVQQHVLEQMLIFAGPQTVEYLRDAITLRSAASSSLWGTAIGSVILLLAATSLIGALRSSLNRVWGVELTPGFDVLLMIRHRSESFLLIVILGLLLFATVIASTLLSAFVVFVSNIIAMPDAVISLLNAAFLFVVTVALFTLLFQYLPDAFIPWRALLPGAFFTALLFLIGKTAFTLFLSLIDLSAFGVAGSFIALLLWVYYSARIFLFGTECTKIYAARIGAALRPQPYARLLATVGPKHLAPSVIQRIRILWKILRFELRIARVVQRGKKWLRWGR